MGNVIVNTRRGPGCLIQILWFVFVGWWLGQLWIVASWLLMVTIVGIPIAVMMLNKLPKIIALREPDADVMVTRAGSQVIITTGNAPQHNILLRALWFILIGWWFSAIWMEVAYILCATLIGLPLGFWMFDRVPGIVSLRR